MMDVDLPASPRRGYLQPTKASLVQTRLEQHGFTAAPRHPCWINRLLPSELIMEIFTYLPSPDDCPMVRIHAGPTDIPIHYTDYNAEELNVYENRERQIRYAQADCDYGDCLAQALFPDGCAKYCSSGYWNYLETLRVCRFWYNSAVSNPHFWAQIPSNSLRTVQRSLQLSGALPIVAIADLDHLWPSALVFTTALQHLPRVSTLEISYAMMPRRPNTHYRRAPWDIGEVLKPFAELPAPMLRVLKLLHWEDKRLATAHWVEQSFPSLEVLDLSGLEITSPCPLFTHTLTELILDDCIAPWNSTSELLLCLGKMLYLRKLHLQSTPLPADLEDKYITTPADLTVPLPLVCLNHLRLDGTFCSVNRLMSMLDVPTRTTSLYLSFTSGYRLGDGAYRQRTQNWVSSIPAAMPIGAYFTSVDMDLDFGHRIVELRFGDPFNPVNNSYEQEVQLIVEWEEHEDDYALLMVHFLYDMSKPFFANSRETRLSYVQADFYPGDTDPRLGPDRYVGCLEDLTDVSSVRLSQDGAGVFLQWMTSKWRQGGSPFPAPKRLSLYRVDLRERVYEHASHARPDHILYVQLWLYLHHHKTKYLSLSRSDVSPRMLAELQRLVADLDSGDVRRVQERERFEVHRAQSDARELLYIWSPKKYKGQRRLLRCVEGPRTRMFWEMEKVVMNDDDELSRE